MPTANQVYLMGNLTSDPQFKELPSGSTVCEFRMAVNDEFTNKRTGQRESRANFVDCVAWGDIAKDINEACQKGSAIFIEGKLQFEQWTDKETGAKRSKLKVRVWEWQSASSNVVDPRDDDATNDNGSGYGHQALDGENIPF